MTRHAPANSLRPRALSSPPVRRYAAGDRVEKWLHGLLCLDAADHMTRLTGARLPHPQECELFAVNRDTLFSAHKDSERFLQRLMALYVASHYRNTPNDLQMLSDAPAHRLFVLLPPVDEAVNALPDVLAVIQVALEGAISRKSAAAQLASGSAPGGDMIPWTVSQQFQDADFPGLTGARVVRIAVHPDLPRLGYGSRALRQLEAFYAGQLTSLSEAAPDEYVEDGAARCAPPGGGLLEEVLRPREGLPPLLVNLADRRPERVAWLGAAFGLTQELLNFWGKLGYRPVYLRQTASDVTGECSTIVLKALGGQADGLGGGGSWADSFCADFRCRYSALLGSAFRAHPPALALSLLAPQLSFSDGEAAAGGVEDAVRRSDGGPLSPHDMKRLQSYASNLVDHHLVRDLVPPLARAYFGRRLPATLSFVQAAILLVLGLQQRDVSDAEAALGLPSAQVLALFNKAVRKLHGVLRAAAERRVEASLPAWERGRGGGPAMQAHATGVDEDLEAGGAEAAEAMRAQAAEMFAGIDMAQFEIKGRDEDWDAALAGGKPPKTGMLSVKRKKGDAAASGAEGRREGGGPEEEEEAPPPRAKKAAGGGGGGGGGGKTKEKQRRKSAV